MIETENVVKLIHAFGTSEPFSSFKVFFDRAV